MMSEAQKVLYCLLMRRLGVYVTPNDISPWGDIQTCTDGMDDGPES